MTPVNASHNNPDKWLFVLLNKNTASAGWWLILQTPDELFEYLNATNSRYGRAFENYLHNETNAVSDNKARYPRESKITQAAYFYAINHGQSIIDGIKTIAEQTARGMLESILTRGYVYVNSAGGYNWIGSREPGDFVRKSKLVWPEFTEKDIRISQFPGGRHFYAHLGPVEIRKNGESRFWTRQQAREAAMEYLK